MLLEQFPLPDEPSAKYLTGYTLLEMVYEEFGAVELRNEFDLAIPDEFEIVVVGGNSKYAKLRKEIKISMDTIRALETLGAHTGPPKRVTTLYRMRTTFMDANRGRSLTTVGYPIAIWQEL